MKIKLFPKFINNWKGISIVALSLLGIILSGYLTNKIINYSELNFCLTGVECDIVNSSRYSKLLGVPVSVFGLIGYLSILTVSFLSLTKNNKWKFLYILSMTGFSFTVYLTFLELYIIKAICSLCILSAIIITLILFLVILKKQRMSPKTSLLKLIVLSSFVLFFVFITLFSIQSPTRAGKLTTPATQEQINLAKHLKKLNSTMYGSYKCPHCNSQKQLFGNAFKYITYVECHSRGPNANPGLCFTKGVKRYPTWEINGKFYEGFFTLEKLSDISDYN
ncbi:MAG: hypothetical protein GTO02_10760 [Candidatus Dadabacteria bacterium]|nr:hypothetical protein [Candidatus Dadabacteria bacterium]NIQ14846.1 hypothetical protein [Candidatus Dadabacteria bacterium]